MGGILKQHDERSKLDQLCNEYPDPLIPFGLLETEWEHFKVSNEGGQLKLEVNRLNDPFLKFIDQRMGGFNGKRVLELGPYEAFHTVGLCQLGAAEVLSIEGNPRNYLKCLIVQNYYSLKAAKFLLGDFTKYLTRTQEKFDFTLAAGVLYHLAYPMVVLDQITAKSRAVGICTTVYDPGNITFEMTGRTKEVIFEGTAPFILHERTNNERLTKGAKHGLEASAWLMTHEDILRFLELRDFRVDVFPMQAINAATRIRLLATKD